MVNLRGSSSVMETPAGVIDSKNDDWFKKRTSILSQTLKDAKSPSNRTNHVLPTANISTKMLGQERVNAVEKK
jgi:hypothetical protein